VRRGVTHFVALGREEFDSAKALITCVELLHVTFSRFKFTSHLEARTEPEGQIELASSSRLSPSIKEGLFTITYDLGVQGFQGDILIIDVGARIEALYSVPKDKSFGDAQMKAFARSNGMLNVWPYWREYVQTATQRAGLAPLTLPLFRVLQKQKKAK